MMANRFRELPSKVFFNFQIKSGEKNNRVKSCPAALAASQAQLIQNSSGRGWIGV
jgi:hypothetical protein